MSRYAVHGALNALAFGVLFPVGVLLAELRVDGWRRAHRVLQYAGVVAASLAYAVLELGEEEPKRKRPSRHALLGRAVLALLAVHVAWAALGHGRLPPAVWFPVHRVLGWALVLGGLANVGMGLLPRFHA